MRYIFQKEYLNIDFNSSIMKSMRLKGYFRKAGSSEIMNSQDYREI